MSDEGKANWKCQSNVKWDIDADECLLCGRVGALGTCNGCNREMCGHCFRDHVDAE